MLLTSVLCITFLFDLFSLVYLQFDQLQCSVLKPWKHQQRRSDLKSKYSEKEIFEPYNGSPTHAWPLPVGRSNHWGLGSTPVRAQRRSFSEYFFLRTLLRSTLYFIQVTLNVFWVTTLRLEGASTLKFVEKESKIRTFISSAVQYGYNFGFIGKETYSWAIIYFLCNMFPTLSLWVKNLKCR